MSRLDPCPCAPRLPRAPRIPFAARMPLSLALAATTALAGGLLPAAVLAQSGAPAPAPASASGPALDAAFGTNGIAVADLGASDDAARGVAVDADGRIVLVGAARPDDRSLVGFVTVRFGTDGTLDPDFGTGGLVHTQVGAGQGSAAEAVAIDADGRIVVAGRGRNPDRYHDTFAVARYTADGRLDKRFGRKGTALVAIDKETGAGRDDLAHAVAIDAEGRILLAGETGGFLHDIALARLLPDGSLDTSFGRKGIAVTDLGGDDRANAIAIAADGSILVAGSGWREGPDEDLVVLRYTADGRLDGSFGVGGAALVDVRGGADRATGVAIRPDGSIVVGGTDQLSGGCANPCERYGFVLAQLTPGGSLDPAFGENGLVTPDLLTSSGAYGLALLPDGTAALAGHIGNEDLGLMLVDPTGQPVPVLDGIALRIDVSGGADRGWSVAATPDGALILAGDTQPAADLTADAVLVKLLPAPAS